MKIIKLDSEGELLAIDVKCIQFIILEKVQFEKKWLMQIKIKDYDFLVKVYFTSKEYMICHYNEIVDLMRDA